MLKNYLTIAIRNLLRNKTYSFINIVGLAVGMAVFILMACYILHELSYDRFHENVDRIYRVVSQSLAADDGNEGPYFPAPLVDLMHEFPEVEHICRMERSQSILVKSGSLEANAIGNIADDSFFDIFDFPLLYGDLRTALEEPMTVVVTEDMATRYFGTDNAIDQILTINQHDYRVTGVLAPLPSNSHLQFDFLYSYASYPVISPPMYWQRLGQSWAAGTRAYIQLTEGTNPEVIAQTMAEVALRGLEDTGSGLSGWNFRLQPLTDIHLHSSLIDSGYEVSLRGNIRVMIIFTSIAFLILAMACINFTNLSTAMLERRAAEVGVRKVVGARRSHLIRQFVGESILMSSLAVLVSLIIVEYGAEGFDSLLGISRSVDSLPVFSTLLLVVIISTLVGIFSGAYPAFVLSRLQPDMILRKDTRVIHRVSLRQFLVTTQFIVSIILIACTVLVFNQLQYMREKDKGVDTSYIVTFTQPASNLSDLYQHLEAFKNDLLGDQRIINMTSKENIFWQSSKGEFITPDDPNQAVIDIPRFTVDYNFIETMKLQLVEGRNYSPQISSDASGAYILNEAAVRALGWDNPIGHRLERGLGVLAESGEVVGIVEDFHYAPLHEVIEPIIICYAISDTWQDHFLVRVDPLDISGAIAHLESVWDKYVPDVPFEYNFLDDEIRELYGDDYRFAFVVGSSSALAIFIACLGLFGLVSLSTTRRTKEIGIRKVVGASVPQVVTLLSKEFLVLVAIANVIAWPIAWYAMRRWLENFAYRIDLSWWIFALAGLLALVIALATVSWQTVRAATANPVEALKYE